MYDIKTSQSQLNKKQQQQQQQNIIFNNQNDKINFNKDNNHTNILKPHLTSGYSSCSIIKLPLNTQTEEELAYKNPADTTHMTLMTLRRRRWLLQRHACLFSIILAFILGMALGIFLPMFGWAHVWQTNEYSTLLASQSHNLPIRQHADADSSTPLRYRANRSKILNERPPSDFPTIYEISRGAEEAENPFTVAFIKEELSAVPQSYVPSNAKSTKTTPVHTMEPDLIKSNIFWGDAVERMLPHGFSPEDASSWNEYVLKKAVVQRLEEGCGRMQNRLVIFEDGKRACARYRQNTDQIQGELFSFYLGQLLNISNVVPSAAAVVNLNSDTWRKVAADISQAQWKEQRPVVLTQWLPGLNEAGIPKPFQLIESHLNKYDIWNMTQKNATTKEDSLRTRTRGAEINQLSSLKEESELIKRMDSERIKRIGDHQSLKEAKDAAAESMKEKLIELAQWSDLIVFDYLIANLDRVVNNLYNYQWNADIMTAPAHNLARLKDSQLLVFLDNESGLLHGYRLLKKYEAFHGLLLDNLCMFRQPTIVALQQLRSQGVGRRLREMFESTTTTAVRDVLPSLPDKSIKILIDRIDRVLGQVQKCRDLLADR